VTYWRFCRGFVHEGHKSVSVTLTEEETVATEIAGEISPQDELVEIQSPEKMDKTKLEKLEQDPLFTLTQGETVATEVLSIFSGDCISTNSSSGLISPAISVATVSS
jgi:hypothetical protein